MDRAVVFSQWEHSERNARCSGFPRPVSPTAIELYKRLATSLTTKGSNHSAAGASASPAVGSLADASGSRMLSAGAAAAYAVIVVDVTVLPLIVAVIVLLPAVVPVKVAVYVPFLLSVTALNVPLPVPLPSANATVKPPVVSLLPIASSACSVTVSVLPEITLADDTVTNDFERLTAPGVTVIAGAVEVTAVPPIVAVTVLLPAVVPGKSGRIRAVLVVGNRAERPLAAACAAQCEGHRQAARGELVANGVLGLQRDGIGDAQGLRWPPTTSRWILTGRLTGPGVTVIAGAVEVTAVPPIVALMVFVPAVVLVNVAVYVPSLLSVTVPKVPWPPLVLPGAKVTVRPPEASWLPSASSACSVTVIVAAGVHARRRQRHDGFVTDWPGRSSL